MVPTLTRATLAMSLVLALAATGLGGAVLTGNAPSFLSPASAPAKSAGTGSSMEVLKEFQGDVNPGVTTGTLDLRTFKGNVQVVGWERAAYDIVVYESKAQGGQRLGDAGVDRAFTVSQDNGLDLKLVVKPTGTFDVNVNQGSDEFAVVAKVPQALAWTTANVCSGTSGGQLGQLDQALQQVADLLGRGNASKGEQAACVDGPAPWTMDFNFMMDNASADVPFEVVGLHGGDLRVDAQYADLGVQDVAFDTASLLTQYGKIAGSLEVPKVAAETQYGDIALKGTLDEAKTLSQYGNVNLQVLGGNSGTLEALSQYGNIVVRVPAGPDRGYDAHAATQYGQATIDLSNAEDTSDPGQTPDATPALPAFALPGLGQAPPTPPTPPTPGSGHGGGNQGQTASARTEGFDEMSVQVKIDGATQYGDVLITDKAGTMHRMAPRGGHPPSDPQQPQQPPQQGPSSGHGADNQPGEFNYGRQTSSPYTGSEDFTWQSNGATVRLNWGAQGDGGQVGVTIKDASGNVVFTHATSGSGDQSGGQDTLKGAEGAWSIHLDFRQFQGRYGLQLQAQS